MNVFMYISAFHFDLINSINAKQIVITMLFRERNFNSTYMNLSLYMYL